MWFCDWLTGCMPFKNAERVNGGYVRMIGPDGEVEKTTVRQLLVRGSFDGKMQLFSRGDDLWFSGNPTKFMQGHNLYGPNALAMHGLTLGFAFAEALGVEPDSVEVQRWMLNEIRLTRIDVTRMLRPEWARPGWVPKWLAIAGMQIHGGQQKVTPASVYAGGTIYVGKGSRRITIKLYDKERELHQHPPELGDAGSIDQARELVAYAVDTLRVEVQLRGMELKARGLEMLSAWSPEKGDEIMDERIAKLALGDDVRMTEEALDFLPREIRAAYRCWLAGDDLRQLFSRRTFYRYRKALLAHGIDITHTRPHAVVTEREYAMGRPLKDYLMGGGLEPPASAIGNELELGPRLPLAN